MRLYTHTHTSVLKNRKNTEKNVGRNLHIGDNVNRNLNREERVNKANDGVYINSKTDSNYNKEANSGCYNSNNYNEQNNIKSKRKVIKIQVVFLMALLVVLVALFTKEKLERRITANTETTIDSKVIDAKTEEALAVNAESIGENARITSAKVLNRKTGTAPWDANNEPGNDESESNDIVRSYDKILWTIESSMAVKENAASSEYKGGTIIIKAELSTNCANMVEWDTASMLWAENAQVSADKRTFTAQYTMPETETTVPGKRELEVIVKVMGVPNELEITPTFSVKLVGNTDDEKCDIVGDKVKTSAAPKYDIEIKNTGHRYSVDRNGIEKKLYTFGLAFRVIGDSKEKGIKGVEKTTGDLTFDIKYEMSKVLNNQTTNIKGIELYNYKYNSYTKTVLGNQENYVNDLTQEMVISSGYPFSNKNEATERYAVYQNGTIYMEDEGDGMIHVRISDYDMTDYFPDRGINTSYINESAYTYEKNIGFISTGVFFMSVDMEEIAGTENAQINVQLEATNIKVNSVRGDTVTTEVNSANNKIIYSHNLVVPAEFGKQVHFCKEETTIVLSSGYSSGDAKQYIGNTVEALLPIYASENNEKKDWIYGVDMLLKFDDKVFEPVLNSNNDEYEKRLCADLTFNVLYAGKKDKTGWESDVEMTQAKIEDLKYFDTLENLKNNEYVCVGVMLESMSGVKKSGITENLAVPLKIKETAPINMVAQATSCGRIYNQSGVPDRETQTHLLTTDPANFPTPAWKQDSGNYKKTSYDEEGNATLHTASGATVFFGDSLLILGANQSITAKTIDESNTEKTKYDLSKNENIAKVQLSPSIVKQGSLGAEVNNITLKLKATLPKGLTYIPGSIQKYAEPEVQNNADGTTTLTFRVNNCAIGKAIEPVIFSTHIDEESDNGKSYTINVTVAEVIGADGESKIGNAIIKDRTTSTSIQIINLSSYTLYKTTETPVIEKNGEIHYKITTLNKTNAEMPDFQLLDILPYNNDSRGTSYHGSYTVSQIKITQTNTTTGTEINNSNLKLYLSETEAVRTGVTVKDADLGTNTNLWKTASVSGGASTANDTYQIGKEITAIAMVGELQARERLEVDIYLQTEGNSPEDSYGNTTTAQTNKETEAMGTPSIGVSDVKRKIAGRVWLDGNKNGIIDTDITSTNTEESKDRSLRGITVMLQKEDGSTAKDINGKDIQPTITNEQGEYVFEDMQKGRYKIAVDISGIGTDYKYYEITPKGVGVNDEINSNVNVTNTGTTIYTTDVIDKLDNIDSPELTADNVNAGITYKDTSVKITKLWQGDGASQVNRPSEITVNLLQNGQAMQNIQISASAGWTKTVEQLPCYDVVLQKKIEYTIQEQVLDGYYSIVARINTAQGNSMTKEQSQEGQSEGRQSSNILENEIETYEYEITNSKYGSIVLTKVDSQNKSKTLSGAKFKIEKEGDASFTEQTQETTSTGQVLFSNLKYGKYKITELEAPSGYNMLTKPIEIEITATQPDYVATISNTALASLPQTGGMNKLIMMIDGILLLIVLLQYRKMKKAKRK